MTKDEALKLALAALMEHVGNYKLDAVGCVQQAAAITAIKEALAQSDQEPLEYWNAVEGWVKIDEVRKHFEAVSCGTIYKTAGEGRVPLYTAPPKREWVRLTIEQMEDIGFNLLPAVAQKDFVEFARAIEAVLKELNHD